jgi:hypothetical protein
VRYRFQRAIVLPQARITAEARRALLQVDIRPSCW